MVSMVLSVGSLQVIPVDDGIGRVTPAELLAAGGAGPGGDTGWEREEHRVFLDAEGRLEMPLGAFVVTTGDRILLVDTGYGPQAPPTVEDAGSLLSHLADHGVEAGDVSDVVFTHLHADHIGWASVDGVAVFPHATYRCDARDWAYFVEGADDLNTPDLPYRQTARRLLAPLADRVELWTGDTTLAPGVDAMEAPGHTPGNTIIALSSGPARALLLGDVVHCPAQLLDADLGRVADVDPVLARRTAERIAREIENDGTTVAGAHFAGLAFGRLLPAEGRRRWVLA
jgi:glyoxylase-like metal-dependent hydrolase (beta-lactamase superfamily II)